MITSLTNGRRVLTGKNLDDTTFHTLIAGDANFYRTVESLTVSCGNTPTDFTLTFKDGANEYTIENARTIAANTSYPLPAQINLPLANGQSLRVKARNANQLSIVVVTIDTPPVQDIGGRGFGGPSFAGANIGTAR